MILLSEEFHNKRDLIELNKFGYLVCEKLQSDLRIEKMGKVISVILLSVVVFSCKKDKIPEPCQGISMSGNKAMLIGTWRWYNTSVEEWFDIGSPIYHDYTPFSEGFDYYFTIDIHGNFKGYENGELRDQHIFSSINSEIWNGSIVNGIEFGTDCLNEDLQIRQFSSNVTNDSIYIFKYPLNFDDEINHLRTKRNYFVRE